MSKAWYERRPYGFDCPRCEETSYVPDDMDVGYCPHCHDWTGEIADDE